MSDQAQSADQATDIVRRVTFDKAAKKDHPHFTPGDTLGVYVKVKEGEKERIQLFKGVVLKISGSGMGRSFTLRKVSGGVGVERTFPFASPAIDRIEVMASGKVRRARLFYLRGLKGRAARLQSEVVHGGGKKKKDVAAAEVSQTAVEATAADTDTSSKS